MNEKAERGILGKALDFMSSTFKSEEGAYARGVDRATNKYAEKIGKNMEKRISKIEGVTKENFEANADFITGQAEDMIGRLGGEGAKSTARATAEAGVAIDALTSGSTKITSKEDFSNAAGKIERKINRNGIGETAKGYFTEPYHTMRNTKSSDEARSLAKRQFIGRTGAAGTLGVGGIGAGVAISSSGRSSGSGARQL